jgi:hypothetical protein
MIIEIVKTMRIYKSFKEREKIRFHPKLGCAARMRRCAKRRFIMKMSRTLAATKTEAAMERLVL